MPATQSYNQRLTGLRWITSKEPKLEIMHELSFSLKLVSPLHVTHLPPVGNFYFPWHRHQLLVSSGRQANVGWTKLPKFRNGSRWDWTTVPLSDSSALYHVITAPYFIPQQAVKNELDKTPTLQETLKAIEHLKSGKAPWIDGIPP